MEYLGTVSRLPIADDAIILRCNEITSVYYGGTHATGVLANVYTCVRDITKTECWHLLPVSIIPYHGLTGLYREGKIVDPRPARAWGSVRATRECHGRVREGFREVVYQVAQYALEYPYPETAHVHQSNR